MKSFHRVSNKKEIILFTFICIIFISDSVYSSVMLSSHTLLYGYNVAKKTEQSHTSHIKPIHKHKEYGLSSFTVNDNIYNFQVPPKLCPCLGFFRHRAKNHSTNDVNMFFSLSTFLDDCMTEKHDSESKRRLFNQLYDCITLCSKTEKHFAC